MGHSSPVVIGVTDTDENTIIPNIFANIRKRILERGGGGIVKKEAENIVTGYL
jgi:hypothetical protein